MRLLNKGLKIRFLIMFLLVVSNCQIVSATKTYFDVVENATIESLESLGLEFKPQSVEVMENNIWHQKINYDYMLFNKNCYDVLQTMPADILDQHKGPDFLQSFEFGIIVGVLTGIAGAYAVKEMVK